MKVYGLKEMKEVFEWKSEKKVMKVEEVGGGEYFLVGSKGGVELFDRRNMEKALKGVKVSSLVDFVYDGNLGLLFVNDADLVVYGTGGAGGGGGGM